MDLVTFTEEKRNGKLHFLSCVIVKQSFSCSVESTDIAFVVSTK